MSIRSIFGELADQRRWVAWREEQRGDRATKVPHSPVRPGHASSTNPETWGTLAEATKLAADAGMGIGIVLGRGLGGIDLDGCRNPETGEIADWAQKVIDGFASYAEISPSKTGVKILAFGAPGELPASTIPIEGVPANGKRPAIEAYVTGRYFAITGDILDGVPDEIVDCSDAGGGWDRMARWLRTHNGRPPENNNGADVILPPAQVQRIRSALAFAGDAEERDDWLRVGMALHSTGAGEQAYGLWTEWSQQSSKYDPADQRRVWNSFKLDREKVATIAKMFDRARSNGWVEDTEGDYDRLEREAIQAESGISDGEYQEPPPGAEALAPPTWRTLADIDDSPPGPLVCGMLEPDGPTLIYAPGGTGKGMTGSWLIAECLKLDIRTLIYDAEGHPREWRRRTAGLGVDPASIVYAEPRDLPPELLGKPLHKVVPYLGKIAKAAGCGLLIIDSILAAANLSEEGLKSDAAAPYLYASALGELGILSVSFGHTPKNSPQGEPYGSVSWTNAMRMCWLGTRAEGEGHRVRWTPRKRNERGEIKPWLLTFTYDESGRPIEVNRGDADLALREWLLDALEADGPQTVNELAERLVDEDTGREDVTYGVAVDRAKDRIRKVLGRLKRTGDAHKVGGRNGTWVPGPGPGKASRKDRLIIDD